MDKYNNGVFTMKKSHKLLRLRNFLGLATVCLAVFMTMGATQAATISYTLDDVFLVDGSQMTGAFDWTYTIGDFEGGSGLFTALEIPWRPGGTLPPLEDAGMVLTIENNQIEISLDGNVHDYGLDISLKFVQPLSPILPSLINLTTSFYECCGNGFKDQFFSGGSISPDVSSVPIPAAFPLFAGGLSLLGLFGWRKKRMASIA
jgi:hypothetical protein